MYIQEATPMGTNSVNETSGVTSNVHAVTVDLSAGIASLEDTETCYGWAYAKTVEHLGLTSTVEPPDDGMWGRLRIEGSTDDIRKNIPNLSGHIGLIARYSAERKYGSKHEKQWIGRILGS